MSATIHDITYATERYAEVFEAFGGISSTLREAPLADAAASLRNYITSARPPSVEAERAKILRNARDVRDPIALHNLLQAAEVMGLAKAVAACFVNTPHQLYATNAVVRAVYLLDHAKSLFVHRNQDMPAREHDAGDDGYRASLFDHLDWVHQYGTLSDCIDGVQHTCLSLPITYLQLLLTCTPMEQWEAAASASHLSPLSAAWRWVRDSPAISVHTLDVVVLVTMGFHIERAVDTAATARKMSSRLSPPGFAQTLFLHGFGPALGLLLGRQRPPRSWEDDKYAFVDDIDTAETLAYAVDKLETIREQYAQLLTNPDFAAQEAQHLVYLLSKWLKVIVTKAEPVVPSSVSTLIPQVSSEQEGGATTSQGSNLESFSLRKRRSARSLRT